MKLFTFWRSQASYRVRIALALKNIDAEYEVIDLSKGEQFDAGYRGVNPEMVLPTLIDDNGRRYFQSLAIIEYLNELYPAPPLLPEDLQERAFVRAIAQIVVSDAHPLIVPRIRNYLRQELEHDDRAVVNWLQHWMDDATRAIEEHLSRSPNLGKFCSGSQPTLADICLVPHLASASMLYESDLTRFPVVRRIFDACMELDAFARTHPKEQADAPSA